MCCSPRSGACKPALAEQHRPGGDEQQDAAADRKRMHSHAKIGKQPAPRDQKKQSDAKGRDSRSAQDSISFVGGALSCERDENWCHAERIDDNDQGDESGQSEL
jgi:hypothetical protein